MEIIEIDSNSKFNIENYVALGNFDGVHFGHKTLLEKAVNAAKRDNKKSSALIFKEHTKNTINQNKQFVLTSTNERYNLLGELGIDYIFEMEFNKDVMKMEPENF
ncbi:MAG: bifunctional riboflavin kinase/FAD synthetase, partial [Gallicola sp.]|nr:bifunctional riboflavin kinase/FAD synthetase [Gallicola sp.]